MCYGETTYACAIARIFGDNFAAARQFLTFAQYPSGLFEFTKNELKEIFGKESIYASSILCSDELLRECEKEVEEYRNQNISIIYIEDRDYPHKLKECTDAPIVLFYRGSAHPDFERAVSIVGTRNATPYGISPCKQIVRHLSETGEPKPVIISGLAYGIDICAHMSALEWGLPTIAVMGTDIHTIYPALHRCHAERICSNGGLITDFHKGSSIRKVNFVRRNRIIAGLSDAVLLIESGEKGGGMITAKMGFSYDRDIYALPGRIDDQYSRGCNLMIKSNIAKPITCAQELVCDLGWQNKEDKGEKSILEKISSPDDSLKQNILLSLTAKKKSSVGELCEMTGANCSEVTVRLTELELDGFISSDTNGLYTLEIQ